MKYIVSFMDDHDVEAKTEMCDTLQDAVSKFNEYSKKYVWVAISIGAWGYLIEWNKTGGATLFRDVDERVVFAGLKYINDHG